MVPLVYSTIQVILGLKMNNRDTLMIVEENQIFCHDKTYCFIGQ